MSARGKAGIAGLLHLILGVDEAKWNAQPKVNE